MLLRSYFLPSYPHPLHNHISHTKHPDILSAFSCLPFPLLVTPVLLLFSLEQKSLCKGHHFLGTQTSSLNTARLIVCVMLSRVNFLTVTRGHACSVRSNSLWTQGLSPARLLCPWNIPGKNTRVGWHFLFQGIFLTQGSNLCPLNLLHWQAYSLPLSHQGSPDVASPQSK